MAAVIFRQPRLHSFGAVSPSDIAVDHARCHRFDDAQTIEVAAAIRGARDYKSECIAVTDENDLDELEFETIEDIGSRLLSPLARFRQEQLDMIEIFKSDAFRARVREDAGSDEMLSTLLDIFENGSDDERAAVVEDMIEMANLRSQEYNRA